MMAETRAVVLIVVWQDDDGVRSRITFDTGSGRVERVFASIDDVLDGVRDILEPWGRGTPRFTGRAAIQTVAPADT